MEYSGAGEEGYTDLMAETYAENIFFHGHTPIQDDYYYLAADVFHYRDIFRWIK